MASFPQPARLLLPALLLSGCVSQGPFPSLAPRPEELNISLAEPQRAAPVVASDATLRQQVAAARAEAQRGERSFDAAYPAAARAVAQAGVEGSASWADAQQMLSRLQAANGDTAAALIALDRLANERADVATNEEDRTFIESALTEVGALAEAQQTRIAALEGRLNR